jgi:hypothetical protein
MKILREGKWWLLVVLGATTQLPPFSSDGSVKWLLFIGEFHPMFVHFPLGLWAATVLILWVGFRSPALVIEPWLRGGAVASFWSGIAAFLTGLVLYLSGTYGDEILSHMYAVWVFLLSLFVFEYVLEKGVGVKKLGWLALVVSGVLGYAGHLGGVITHGDVFESLTWEVQAAMEAPVEGVKLPEHQDVRSVFEAAVYPILDDKCLLCHAERRARAGLTMTSESSILKGGVSGASIIAGEAEASMMIQRIQLPEEDPLHMPLMEPFVTSDEEAFLIWWINEGLNKKVYEIPVQFASFIKPITE